MHIDVWSDVVCPWCAIGARRLHDALGRFEHAGAVTVRWRAYELDPGAPAVRTGDPTGRLARRYGFSPEAAAAAQRRLEAVAAADGLEFHLDRTVAGNTFDAHRLLAWAAAEGDQEPLRDRLHHAYFAEGLAVGDRAVLVTLAAAVGLDPGRAAEVLAGDAYGAEVRADEAEAAEREITGVPYFLVDGRLAVPGAQDAATMLRVLERAWARTAPPTG